MTGVYTICTHPFHLIRSKNQTTYTNSFTYVSTYTMTNNPQLQNLYEIWHNKGRNPAYHEKIQAEVWKIFPTLALALEHLTPPKNEK